MISRQNRHFFVAMYSIDLFVISVAWATKTWNRVAAVMSKVVVAWESRIRVGKKLIVIATEMSDLATDGTFRD